MILSSLTTRATLVALVVVLAVPMPSSSAWAADDTELTWGVQPSTPQGPDGRSAFDFHVAPGTQISDWVAVTNDSPVAATFRVYAADATTDYETAAFTLVGAEQASTDLGAWTAVGAGPVVCPDTDDEAEAACTRGLGIRVDLAPGEQKNLPITITVPADATPGDHAAGVVAAFEQQATDASGSAVRVEQRVGTRIYLRVDGPLTASVGVSGVVAGYDSAWNPVEAGTGRVGFDVTNTGNVRLSGTPEVHLTGPFGVDLATVTLDPVANLLPGGTGHVEAEVPDVPPLLFVRATVTVTPQAGDDATGAAILDLAPVTAAAVAWAVPWTALGVLLLVVAVAVLIVWWRRRSRRLLAAELAAYADEIRAEALASPSGGETHAPPSIGNPGVTTSPDPSDESETVR